MNNAKIPFSKPLSRRRLLRQAVATGAGLGAVSLGGPNPLSFGRAWAEDHPPIGTWPDGSSGSSVTIGITVPRTGTYALQGEDELKGMQLAVEHINEGNELIKKISPKTTKGVLGKEVKYVVADSEAKPNTAVQEQSRFITENKIVLMTGSTSSAVAVALNKLAEREKVLYAVAISGSNDTTGKDCVRYSFRQCFYGQTAAAAIGPVVVKTFGKNKKAAYLTPDYTYGHTVTKSMNDYLDDQCRLDHGDQPGRAARRARLLSPTCSTSPTPAPTCCINVNWGHDAVLSTQQAKQFGVLDKMKLVMPYQISVPRQRGGTGDHGRRLCRHRFLVDARGQVSAGQDVRRGVRQEVRLQAGMGRQQRLHAICHLGGRRRRCRQLLSAGRHQVLRSRAETIQSTVGEVHFRAEDHQLVRPVIIVRGKKPKRDEEQGGLLGGPRSRSRRRR